MKNPWLGLSSYTESSIKDYQFNGRSEAINALTELIRQNLFVTLYGRSGVGKTSLLQAGVFPVLRKYGMIPVTIRLNEIKDGESKASEVLWRKICDVLGKQGYQFNEDAIDPYTPDFSDVLILRNLFSSGRFINEEGVIVTPVIVLDQFEEFLYNSPKASRLLISQMYALIDDNVNLKVPHPTWHDDTDFRIVVSIREDDLYLFEDLIDRLNSEGLKSNRYRLMPLSETDAKEIILKPSKDKFFFEEGQEDAISKEIIKLSKTNGDSINTLMLSLICYVLYNNFVLKNQRISLNSLSGYKDILESYYLESIKNIPKSQRFYLEDNLVDSQGRRKSIYLSDLNKRAPKAKELIGDSISRLLTVNQGRVELIHDQLAASVSKLKTNRKKRKTRKIGIFVLIICLIALFVFSFSYPYPPTKHGSPIESSNNFVVLENAILIEDYIIEENDKFNGWVSYKISSCPNLKSIKIKKKTTNIRIFNCPRLTQIDYPDNFSGSIDVYNCPHLIVKDKINYIRDWKDLKIYFGDDPNKDSLKFYEFNSEYDLDCAAIPSDYYDSLQNKLSYPKSLNYKGNVYTNKKGKIFKGIVSMRTGIPDSLKIITDLYVPYGMSEYYKQFNMFMPFRTIRELPFYSLWLPRAKDMLLYFEDHPYWAMIAMCGLIVLQLIFWIIGLNNFKGSQKKIGLRILMAFAYGLGMSLVGLLSFLAFYWFVFIILLPYNQIVSILCGIGGCLICLFLIYKNAFYSLFLYFKENGVRFIIEDIGKSGIRFCKRVVHYLRTHGKSFFICMGLIISIGICYCIYVGGKNRRLAYLSQLQLVVNKDKLAKIIELLESQHGSIFYGFFTDSLQVYKENLRADSLKLVCKITPDYLSRVAKENNIEISLVRFPWSDNNIDMVSADGTKQCIRVLSENNREYLLFYDMNLELVDTIISYDNSVDNINCSFSPTEENIIVSTDNKIYDYSTKYHITTRFPYSLKLNVVDVLMYDEDSFVAISESSLYNGSFGSEEDMLKLNNDYSEWNDNLILIGKNKFGANSYFLKDACVYDLDNNELSILSADEMIGSLISATSDKLVASKGYFNLKNRVFIAFEDPIASKFVVDDKILSIAKSCKGNNCKYVIKNAESGEVVNTIYIDDDDSGSSFGITKDGNFLLTNNTESIFIYSLNSENTSDWPISDLEKRIFDLK